MILSPPDLLIFIQSLGYAVVLRDDRVWLRYDVADCDDETEEQHDLVWREYCEIQEHLRANGYEIQYPAEVEHDCISGDVVPYTAEPFEPVPMTHRYQP